MWTYLENWLVQDGEIPELQAGDVLQHVAVRASCWGITESHAPEGLSELQGPYAAGDAARHYELTGTVEWGREPSTVLLRVGPFHVLAEPNSYRGVGSSTGDVAGLEPYAPNLRVPALGTRVTVFCQLQVMADYETEAFDFPDARRDWQVRRVRLEHRNLVLNPSENDGLSIGDVVAVVDIDRMRRWADDNAGSHVTYCLDLGVPD